MNQEEYIQSKQDEILRLTVAYDKDPSIEIHNELSHAHQCLSNLLLMRRAVEGATLAVIEYSQVHRPQPIVQSVEALASSRGLTKEECLLYVHKLAMLRKCPDIESFTAKSLTRAYENNMLNSEEYRHLLTLAKLARDATDHHQLEGNIEVKFINEVRETLGTYSDPA